MCSFFSRFPGLQARPLGSVQMLLSRHLQKIIPTCLMRETIDKLAIFPTSAEMPLRVRVTCSHVAPESFEAFFLP